MRTKGGLVLMVLGIILAVVAALLVMAMSRNVAKDTQEKVLVVMATRDICELTAVSGDALAVKPFPAEFVPQGAIAGPEQAVGKYAVAHVLKDQIIVAGQLSATRKTGSLAASITTGKVAMALRISDAMNAIGALRPGDHVDVLLTLDVGKATAGQQGQGGPGVLSTQTTLQNAEILNIGSPEGSTPNNQGPGPTASRRSPS